MIREKHIRMIDAVLDAQAGAIDAAWRRGARSDREAHMDPAARRTSAALEAVLAATTWEERDEWARRANERLWPGLHARAQREQRDRARREERARRERAERARREDGARRERAERARREQEQRARREQQERARRARGSRTTAQAARAPFTSAYGAERWMREYSAMVLGPKGARYRNGSLRKLYRALAMHLHPDRGGGRADWDRLDQARRLLSRAGRL